MGEEPTTPFVIVVPWWVGFVVFGLIALVWWWVG